MMPHALAKLRDEKADTETGYNKHRRLEMNYFKRGFDACFAALADEIAELNKTSPSGKMALQIGKLKDEILAKDAEIERLKADNIKLCDLVKRHADLIDPRICNEALKGKP